MELNKGRKITKSEEMLVTYLIKRSRYQIVENWQESIKVLPLNDGNMGSIELIMNNNYDENRKFYRQIAECHFFDIDNIKVIASLNIDTKGDLYELDIWKTDFSSLIKIPTDVSLFYKELN